MKFVYTLFAFFLTWVSYSQVLSYRSYNVNQGLPSSQTYDVLQDSHQYIWISTDHGVSRFDGYTFKNFTTADGLLSNLVLQLYEDPFGRVWFISYTGVLCYYENGIIKPFKYNSLIPKESGGLLNLIRSFSVLSDSTVMIGDIHTGLTKVSPLGSIEKIGVKSSSYIYSSFLVSYSNRYYMGNVINNSGNDRHQISFYHEEHKLYEKIYRDRERNVNYKSQNLLERKNKHIIYVCFGEIFELYEHKIICQKKLEKDVLSLYEDSDSCLWISYFDGGIKRYQPNKSFNDQGDKTYFPESNISSMLEDYEHGFWFTTLYHGVMYVPSVKIETLENNNHNSDEKTTALTTDYKSKIIVGTNKGNVHVFSKGKLEATFNYDRESTYSTIKTLFHDSVLNQLYVYNYKKVFIVNDFKRLKQVYSPGLLCFQRDDHGILYVGSYYNVIKDFPNVIKATIKHSGDMVRIDAMCMDSSHRIWVGSTKGLYYIEGNNIVKYTKEPLLNTKIVSMVYKNHFFYIGTAEKGVLRWNGKQVRSFTKANGLSSNTINAMVVENDSIIWVGTPEEVCKMNSLRGKVLYGLNFNKGLAGNEVKDIKILNDTVYVLTYDGISFFRSDYLFKNTVAPVIYIEDFREDTVSYIKVVSPILNHDHNYITVNVTALSYKQSGKVNYWYRLLGYSEEWRHSISNTIQFAFVPPGTYTFEITAVNEDGVYSKHPAIFKFTVSQPFWKELWVQFMGILTGITIIIAVSYTRLKRIKEKNKIMEQLASFRQQALTMQMNPHFIFNSLTSIQSYVLSEKPLKASKYLAMFSKLMRKSLENSRKEFIHIQEELNALELYLELETMRTKNGFTFKFGSNSDQLYRMMIPPMLIQPHVENAIKHGLRNLDITKKGEITIDLYMVNKFLYCRIDDNGIGLTKAAGLKENLKPIHQSTGIEVTKTRLELLCHNLKFPFSFSMTDKGMESITETGTIVEFLIPYIYEDQSPDSGR